MYNISLWGTMYRFYNFTGALLMADPIVDGTACPMDDDISLVFSSNTFGFVKDCGLFSMFCRHTCKNFKQNGA